MEIERLREKHQYLKHEADSLLLEMKELAYDSRRATETVVNADAILGGLEKDFETKTGLDKTDTEILFLATGLQIIRQYLLTQFPERMDDKTAADSTWGHGEEHSNRKHRYYNPSIEEIITNPVPFDANIGANGQLSGGGSLGHRVTVLGHDPLLGLVFGTANIATSTLTTSKLNSFHIYTNGNNRDYFRNQASTVMVLEKTAEKITKEGIMGKTKVAASLMKEVIHLKSDLYTKNSLPLPGLSVIDPKFASAIAEYGFDMANAVTVGKQASYSMLINTLIAMLHRLMYDDRKGNKKLYEVKTRKILSYSNLIASSTNVAVVAVTKDMKKLDIGGLAVTVYRLITDRKFMNDIKEEFVFGTFSQMI